MVNVWMKDVEEEAQMDKIRGTVKCGATESSCFETWEKKMASGIKPAEDFSDDESPYNKVPGAPGKSQQ